MHCSHIAYYGVNVREKKSLLRSALQIWLDTKSGHLHHLNFYFAKYQSVRHSATPSGYSQVGLNGLSRELTGPGTKMQL